MFIIKGCSLIVCLSRQALMSIFESAVSCTFITARVATEMVSYYLNEFPNTFIMHINPFGRVR